jgi:hypothetical protein
MPGCGQMGTSATLTHDRGLGDSQAISRCVSHGNSSATWRLQITYETYTYQWSRDRPMGRICGRENHTIRSYQLGVLSVLPQRKGIGSFSDEMTGPGGQCAISMDGDNPVS